MAPLVGRGEEIYVSSLGLHIALISSMMFFNWHKVIYMRLWLRLFLAMETHKSKYRQMLLALQTMMGKKRMVFRSKRGLQVSDELIKFSNLYHASTFTLSHTLLCAQQRKR